VVEVICPLLSKSGLQPSECLKNQCVWFIEAEQICVIHKIAKHLTFLPQVEEEEEET